MSLIALLKPRGPSGFGYGSTAEQVSEGISLRGQTVVVTGCNSGLGLETCRVLALRGATIIGLARTREKAESALANFAPGTGAVGIACELSDPSSVRAAVAEIRKRGARLDRIICNAGIMALPRLEKDCGYERQFFTNHIGHYILVMGLLDSLAEQGRVIVVSSAAHFAAPRGGVDFDNLRGERGYSAWSAYGRSKFANLLFAKELARRLHGTGKTAYALHPGVIDTNLGRNMHAALRWVFGLTRPLFLKSIQQGAATTVYLATQPRLEAPSGSYFKDCNVTKCRPDGDSAETARRLWEVSERIVKELSEK